ncbi:LysR family transcriptional regulator [Shimia sp. R9_3]|uniref:LysR family transcriptional regulator n=1 Tax=Shimia sp. R9_3 TaxID=2821113 RepID=UPI001AD9EC0C|nr:LysR family transcriptional regulator [Shimia sp. R9_3]MBO9403042.1 LysR family transcriptional regulator [Shimia sp. R9_3]
MIPENALTAFLALAEKGSFQGAARAMGVSNASLSRYINQAEQHVGTPLFHRSRNSSTLTRAGQEFLPIAEGLRQDLNRYATHVAKLRDRGPGVLHIGCGPLTTRTLIQPAIRAVRAVLPDLRFRVLVSAYGRPLDLLQAGQFDIFLGDLTYTPEADNVEIMVMQKRAIQFMAHRDHAIHDGGPRTLSEVFAYPFASPYLHKHWRSTLTKALGGDVQAEATVSALPQIESDDYHLLTGLLSEPEYIVGGVAESFSEIMPTGQAKPVSMAQEISWNICAARKVENTSLGLEAFWEALAAHKI